MARPNFGSQTKAYLGFLLVDKQLCLTFVLVPLHGGLGSYSIRVRAVCIQVHYGYAQYAYIINTGRTRIRNVSHFTHSRKYGRNTDKKWVEVTLSIEILEHSAELRQLPIFPRQCLPSKQEKMFYKHQLANRFRFQTCTA